ncbi:MAG TPA: hypothetical protein VGQ02_10840 [Candidatus Limnocylindrales bacterium]|jgi:hypothetical protein|nr:hypothetical protein [Candidatus Limnocylindrales bacterium]
MADRTQELTLLLRAKIAGQGALDTMSLGLDKVAEKASGIGRSFSGMGSALANGLGNATETLASGGGLGQAAAGLGVYMAGQLVENFGGNLIEKLASSSLVAAISAPLAAVGSTIGGIIAAAIPIGMALLPFILIGAIVAAIGVLIFNEEIRNKVLAFVGQVIGNIGKFLGDVGKTLLDKIGAGVDWVAKNIGPFVGGLVKAIIDGLVSLPGKIADVIRDAFRSLKIDIGPFHIRSTGVTIDLPEINLPSGVAGGKGGVTHYQSGGWAGLKGPELAIIGEHEPELVTPLSKLGGGGGGLAGATIVLMIGATEVARAIIPAVSEALYYELQAAPAIVGRV